MMIGWLREMWQRWYQVDRFWTHFEDRAEKLDDGLSLAWEKRKKTLSFVLQIVVLSCYGTISGLEVRENRIQICTLLVIFLNDMNFSFSKDVCLCAQSLPTQLCPTLFETMDWASQAPLSMGILQARITGVGCHDFLWRDFPGPDIKLEFLMLATLAGWFFPTSATWEAHTSLIIILRRYTNFKV